MSILKGGTHHTAERYARCAVIEKSGDDFPSAELDEQLSWNVITECIFEKFCIMAAHAKDEEIACLTDNSVLQFVVVNLR